MKKNSAQNGRVAQLDRVSASEAEGRGSESRLVHHIEAIEMHVSMAFFVFQRDAC